MENRSCGTDAPRAALGTRRLHARVVLAFVLSTSIFISCGGDQPARSTEPAPSHAAPSLSQQGLRLQILLAQLHHDSGSKRREAATDLGSLGDPAAVPALKDALDDEDSSVRSEAASALGFIGEPAAVGALSDALDDVDPSVRWSAAQALGFIADPAAVPALSEALNDADSFVRSVAVEALVAIGDSGAVEPLLALVAVKPTATVAVGERDPFLEAVRALGTLGDARAVARLLELAAGPADVDSLTVLLVTQAADDALDAIGPAAIPALTGAVGSPDAKIALAATTALGRRGPAAIPGLAKSVRSPHADAALAAVTALGRLGAPALDPLLAALGDKRSAIRVAAASALGGFGKPALKPLFAALKHKDAALRVAAATSLGQIGDRAATSPLIAALADAKVAQEHGGDRGLFHEASAALASIHRGDATALVKYLKVQKTVGVYYALIRIGQADTRSALVTALRKFGDVSMAEEYLNSGEPTLEKTARDWAKAHGYTVGPSWYPPCIGPRCSGPAWGGG